MSEFSLPAFADQLDGLRERPAELPIVSGFDAFVDSIFQVVGTRHSPRAYDPVPTIPEFGAWISASGGKSGLREAVLLEETAGGCTVNQGDGLATLGFPLTAFCNVGDPPHPVFESFRNKCRACHPVGIDPGQANAFEFRDGKLIFCSFSHFEQFGPGHLEKVFSDGKYQRACEEAKGIVLTSWSVFPHMTECWRFLRERIFSQLTHRPRFYFDLADPASRSLEAIRSMVECLSGFEEHGPVTFGLNGNEATQIAAAMALEAPSQDTEGLARLAVALREQTGIDEVSIHSIRFAVSASRKGTETIQGKYCPHPKKSVGAGDRFNAGYLAAQLLGFGQMECLAFGSAASGFFVREGRSASFSEIGEFLRKWARGDLDREVL